MLHVAVEDGGKPVGAAIDEVTTMADNLRFFAGAARLMEGKAANEYLAGHTSFVRRDPVGVVASIAPWNNPTCISLMRCNNSPAKSGCMAISIKKFSVPRKSQAVWKGPWEATMRMVTK